MILSNIVIYIFIGLIGICFGSFFTLAVYRIPLGQDITHTRSYCPNCNHKLSFWDMIPVFSYIFLSGKCRYCHKKIRIRYILLEIFSGIVFVLFAMSIKFNINIIDNSKFIYLIFGFLYIAGLFIIAGIDKEKFSIRNEVLLYIILVEVFYIIYLYIVEKASIYRYVICLFIVVILIVINNLYFGKKAKNNYVIQTLVLVMSMLMFTFEICTILTIISTLLAIGIEFLIKILKDKKKKYLKHNDKKISEYKIPIGFYLCSNNIIMLILTNIVIFYNIWGR